MTHCVQARISSNVMVLTVILFCVQDRTSSNDVLNHNMPICLYILLVKSIFEFLSLHKRRNKSSIFKFA